VSEKKRKKASGTRTLIRSLEKAKKKTRAIHTAIEGYYTLSQWDAHV
jgi:molybdate-binding protein